MSDGHIYIWTYMCAKPSNYNQAKPMPRTHLLPNPNTKLFGFILRSISGVVGTMNRSGRKDAASGYIFSLRIIALYAWRMYEMGTTDD